MEFTLKPKPLTFTEQPAPFTGSSLKNLKDLQIGSGATQFKADNQGIYLGAEAFADAVFSVNMEGDLIANSITINGADVSNAFNASANFLNDVINARLDTSSKKILSDFDFGTTDYAGAVKAGDIAWNTTTGAITGGDGVAIYRGGIVGAKAGVATFSIDASTGDATFAGTLSAPSGTLGTITAGTITGGTITGVTIQTAVAGLRMKMTTTQFMKWYDGNDEIGSIGILPTTDDLQVTCDGDLYLVSNGSGDSIFSAAGTGGYYVTSNGVIDLNAANNFSVTCDDCIVYYNDDNDNSDCSWVSNTTERMNLDQSGNLTVGNDLYALGDIRCGGRYESSDGSDGLNQTIRGYVSGIRYDGGTLQVRYTELTFKDGIITDYGSESDWFDV
jgi:hypothetical protein